MKAAMALGLAILGGGSLAARAQSCPREDAKVFSVPSVSRSLTGRVVYHEGIRSWFGLQFDLAVCGQKEIELIVNSSNDVVDTKRYRVLKTLRGCHASVRGKLDLSPTMYYSTEMYQNVEEAKPASDCKFQSPLPDYSKARPDPSVRHYEVSVTLDYGKNSPIRFVVRRGNSELHPWQAYAKYFLNGERDFTGSCADGFDLKLLSASHNSKAQEMDNQVLTVEQEEGSRVVSLRYQCKKR